MIKTAVFFLVTLSFSLLAAEPYFCGADLGAIPIQQNGRVKPLYVHAKETLKQLTGKGQVETTDAVTAYCLMSLKAAGLPSSLSLNAPIEHVELKKMLGMSEQQHHLPFAELIEQKDQVRAEYMRIKAQNSKKKALGNLLSRIQIYNRLVSGEDWTLPEFSGDRVDWLPLPQWLTQEKVAAAGAAGAPSFKKVIVQAAQKYTDTQKSTHRLEYRYAKAHLPGWALLVTLLALAALTVFKTFNTALFLSAATLLIQTVLIVVRVMISGRAPITNMYETVMFSGYGALLLAMIVGHLRKEKTFVYVGLAYNACTLMMMNFAGGMLDDRISPLVPVLRDNFWLSTHVITIIMSYGALALSWILANTIMIKKRFLRISSADENYYSDLTYTCLKYGTIMLAAGIILGGVWADYSWGRFWGWDPKETWSLIVLCIYMAILHGRYTNWIPNHRFIPLTAGAFMSVMMAWFGVNYILASGLHSYGFSEGGAIFLGSFFLVQSGVLLISLSRFGKSAPKPS